ncbi:MAG: hypothetical protein ACM3JG_06190, partial [Thiohalocapsa sp.]
MILHSATAAAPVYSRMADLLKESANWLEETARQVDVAYAFAWLICISAWDDPVLQTVGVLSSARHRTSSEQAHRTVNVTIQRLDLQEKEFPMYLAVKCCPVEPQPTVSRHSVDGEIRAFLAGKTDGEDLLHAIYDHVIDEPIPDRL